MVSIQSAIAAYSCTVSLVWVKCLSYYSWAGILLSSASVFHLTFAVEGNCLELSLWQHWRRDDLVLSNDRLEQCPRHTCLGHWLVLWYCEMMWPSSEKICIAYSCFVSHLTVLMSFFTLSWQVWKVGKQAFRNGWHARLWSFFAMQAQVEHCSFFDWDHSGDAGQWVKVSGWFSKALMKIIFC